MTTNPMPIGGYYYLQIYSADGCFKDFGEQLNLKKYFKKDFYGYSYSDTRTNILLPGRCF